MRVTSANLNGIRSASKKGFIDWMLQLDADVVCLQETKAQEDQLNPAEHHPAGYHTFFFDAQQKGYSGVAIFSKREPDRVIRGLGAGFEDMDAEGRYIQADFGNLSIISLYLPSGSAKEERQQVKFSFMERFTSRLEAMRNDGRDYIICGDWNIVHKEIDIKNWKSNQKTSGCLPEERAWLDLLFDKQGWVDGFRVVNQEKDQYTWWSNRGQAWAKNVGWRIDYQVVSPSLAAKIIAASIYKEQRFSDHAPLTLDYQGTL
ncbi:MAG: exodeoxyribonuclease III [Gammaproteobacteria bacterium]|nr:exodeoxyribonuclease III [Gammaproteobacteria bacterium]